MAIQSLLISLFAILGWPRNFLYKSSSCTAPLARTVNSLQFEVIGIPQPQGSARAFVPKRKDGTIGRPVITSDNKNLKAWRDLVSLVAQDHAPASPLEGAIELILDFNLPVPKSAPKTRMLKAVKRPDIDKLCRSVADALTGIFYKDDSQIVYLKASKSLAYGTQPGVRIWIGYHE